MWWILGAKLHEARGLRIFSLAFHSKPLVQRLSEGTVESADMTGAYLRSIKARMVYPLNGRRPFEGLVFGDVGATASERSSSHGLLKQWSSATVWPWTGLLGGLKRVGGRCRTSSELVGFVTELRTDSFVAWAPAQGFKRCPRAYGCR